MRNQYRRIKKWEILELRRLRILSMRMQEVLNHYRYQKDAFKSAYQYALFKNDKELLAIEKGRNATLDHIIDYMGHYESEFKNHRYTEGNYPKYLCHKHYLEKQK